MGLWGTEQVWPRNARLPRIDPLRRPLVTVRIGPPVDLTYDDPDTDTKRIMAALMDLLPPGGPGAPHPHRGGAPPHVPRRATAATRTARPNGAPGAIADRLSRPVRKVLSGGTVTAVDARACASPRGSALGQGPPR